MLHCMVFYTCYRFFYRTVLNRLSSQDSWFLLPSSLRQLRNTLRV